MMNVPMEDISTPNLNLSQESIFWTVFGLMVVSSIVFFILALRVPKGERLYHYVAIVITATSALAYLTMTAQEGSTLISLPYGRMRRIFYVHYIEWAITKPLILFELLLLAGTDQPSIFFSLAAIEGIVATGFFADLETRPGYKWGYLAFTLLLFIFIAYVLLLEVPSASRRGPEVRKLYRHLSSYIFLLWFLYALAWILAAANVLSGTTEVLWFSILDVFSKSGFGFWLLLDKRLPIDEKRGTTRALGGHYGSTTTTTTTLPEF